MLSWLLSHYVFLSEIPLLLRYQMPLGDLNLSDRFPALWGVLSSVWLLFLHHWLSSHKNNNKRLCELMHILHCGNWYQIYCLSFLLSSHSSLNRSWSSHDWHYGLWPSSNWLSRYRMICRSPWSGLFLLVSWSADRYSVRSI